MRLHIWGIDFRRSSGEFRRRFFIAPEQRAQRLQELRAVGFEDLIYLATCNRIELYTTAKDPFTDLRPLWLEAFRHLGLNETDFFAGYHLEGKSAVRHLLRVAASLESLVVGEPQILGQLKEALAFSEGHGLPTHPSTHRVFQLAFETAKKVRTETSIGDKPVSIATLGIQRLKQVEAEHPLEHLVVVGRSPISRLMMQWVLAKRPHCRITWVNRTVENLRAFEESQRVALVSLSDFLKTPGDFSHLVTATASSEPIFDSAFFERLPPRLRLVMDFAEPADVKGAGSLATVRLIQIEDLKEEAARNAAERSHGIHQVEALIENALRDFFRTQKEAPLLKDFNRVEPSFQEAFRAAWESLHRELPGDYHLTVKRWAEGLVKKNLHLSREHLKGVLRNVVDPPDRDWLGETNHRE